MSYTRTKPSPSLVSRRPKTQRALWVDALRGSAILFVLLWHGIFAVNDDRVFSGPAWEISTDLETLRMPVLFFLSAIFLPYAFRKSAWGYTYGKLAHLVWPLLVWKGLDIWISRGASELFTAQNWGPIGYLWFMYFLCIYFAFAFFLRRLPLHALLVIVLAIFICVEIGSGLIPNPDTQDLVRRISLYSVYFFAGASASRWILGTRPGITFTRIGIAAVASALFWYLVRVQDIDRLPVADNLTYLLASIPAIAAAVALALMIGHRTVFRPLQWVGQNSVIFYTTHMPIMVMAITYHKSLGVGGYPAVTVGFVTALLVGCVLTYYRRWLVVNAWFVFPAWIFPDHLRYHRVRRRLRTRSLRRTNSLIPPQD